MSYQDRINEYQEKYDRDQGEEELDKYNNEGTYYQKENEGDEYDDEGDWVREEANMQLLYGTDDNHDLSDGYEDSDGSW